MYFDVYDISGMTNNDVNLWISDNYDENVNKVEMGLSPGEVRQSLLDRFREDIYNSNVSNINKTLTNHLELSINPALLKNSDGKKTMVQDVENLLYSLEDDEILGEWIFSKTAVYISEEE